MSYRGFIVCSLSQELAMCEGMCSGRGDLTQISQPFLYVIVNMLGPSVG